MKIKYSIWWPPFATGINWFSTLIIRKKKGKIPTPPSAVFINHELIHTAQAEEAGGWIIYYLKYILNWVKHGFSYYDICYEKEAYSNQSNLKYLQSRPKNNHKKYE